MHMCYFSAQVFLVVVAQISAAGEELAQSAYLDPAEKFHLRWSFTDDDITFTLTVNTTGWFGLGFSENGGMAGADIILAGVKDGQPYLWDMHATTKTKPIEDAKQNVDLISGSEKDGQTSVTFKRKHVTCDTDDDLAITEDTMRLIYAMSPDNSDVLSYHSGDGMFRGARSLYLRHSILPPASNIPDDAISIDIRSTNFEIPSDRDTLYTCELIRVPTFRDKHHLIQMDPLINPENLGMVHHMILYGCYDDMDREHILQKNQVYDCTGNANMPGLDDIRNCFVPVAIWAIGGGSIYYPEEAGLPFGDKDSPRYLMMEVHYDNPQLLSGHFDNSGLRLIFTPTLRTYDAGVMPTGAIGGITVPPGAKDFRSTGFCASDCSKTGWEEPINVYGVALHGHLATRQILARHFRNGTELEMLSSDRHYDFNYQQYKAFKQPKQILPGDDLMVTCHYDTSDRDIMTYGGQPSRSEMCIAFLMYYPAQDIGHCYSAPGWWYDSTYLTSKVGIPYIVNASVDYMLNNATSNGFWTAEKVAILQEGYLEGQQILFCHNRTGTSLNPADLMYNAPESSKGAEPSQQVAAPAHCSSDSDGEGNRDPESTNPNNEAGDGNSASHSISTTSFLALAMTPVIFFTM